MQIYAKMESGFAVSFSVLSFLVIISLAVDVTLENVDDHSPFSEENENVAHEDGNKVWRIPVKNTRFQKDLDSYGRDVREWLLGIHVIL